MKVYVPASRLERGEQKLRDGCSLTVPSFWVSDLIASCQCSAWSSRTYWALSAVGENMSVQKADQRMWPSRPNSTGEAAEKEPLFLGL